MRIPIRLFQKQSHTVSLNGAEAWIIDVFKNLFHDGFDPKSIQGQIQLSQINGNVTLIGNICYDTNSYCSRCGEALQKHHELPLQGYLLPFHKEPHDSHEKELAEEELDSCFYHNEEVNLTNFLNEELALTLDVNDYCSDENACEARAQKLLEPLEQKNTNFQWDKLKNLKPKK